MECKSIEVTHNPEMHTCRDSKYGSPARKTKLKGLRIG
jgi:hypothetical protein